MLVELDRTGECVAIRWQPGDLLVMGGADMQVPSLLLLPPPHVKPLCAGQGASRETGLPCHGRRRGRPHNGVQVRWAWWRIDMNHRERPVTGCLEHCLARGWRLGTIKL